MKCPLSNYVMERESGEDEVLLSDCLKEECAWWDKAKDMCFRVSEVKELSFIRSLLREIREKMPSHERLV